MQCSRQNSVEFVSSLVVSRNLVRTQQSAKSASNTVSRIRVAARCSSGCAIVGIPNGRVPGLPDYRLIEEDDLMVKKGEDSPLGPGGHARERLQEFLKEDFPLERHLSSDKLNPQLVRNKKDEERGLDREGTRKKK